MILVSSNKNPRRTKLLTVNQCLGHHHPLPSRDFWMSPWIGVPRNIGQSERPLFYMKASAHLLFGKESKKQERNFKIASLMKQVKIVSNFLYLFWHNLQNHFFCISTQFLKKVAIQDCSIKNKTHLIEIRKGAVMSGRGGNKGEKLPGTGRQFAWVLSQVRGSCAFMGW